jgi:hypothetical protein
MGQLLLTLLVVAVIFAVFVVGGGFLALRWINAVLTREQQKTDWVLSTGLAPQRWWRGQRRFIAFLERVGAPPRIIRWFKTLFKRRIEYRLAAMIRYLERSTVIPDDGIRATTTSTLREVGRRWENSSWADVTGTADDP